MQDPEAQTETAIEDLRWSPWHHFLSTALQTSLAAASFMFKHVCYILLVFQLPKMLSLQAARAISIDVQ